MQAIKHRHRWSLVAALIAMALPPLIMAPLIWWMAQDRAKGESAITAATIQRQVDGTLDVVFDNVHHAVGLLDRPCPDAAPELARQANITFYYRSLSLMKHGRLYCTSLIGGVNFAPRDVFDGMPTLPAARAITPIAGSLVVPDRPAIVVSESTAPGTGAMAVIDGQYLLDIQKAASNNGEFRVRVDMNDTGEPLSPSVPADGTAAFSARASAQARSSRYPVVVTVAPALAAVAAHRPLPVLAPHAFPGHRLADRRLCGLPVQPAPLVLGQRNPARHAPGRVFHGVPARGAPAQRQDERRGGADPLAPS